MGFVKAVIIFFLGLFMLGRLADMVDTKEKRDIKIEMLWIAEVILSVVGIVWLFKV